jgi:hypothetical protein
MSRRLRNIALCIIVLLFCLSGTTLGHDVQASWTTVLLRPDSCVLTIRIHAETVRPLIQDTAPGATFEPENIDKFKPALQSFGRTLYEVSADGQTLTATGRTRRSSSTRSSSISSTRARPKRRCDSKRLTSQGSRPILSHT